MQTTSLRFKQLAAGHVRPISWQLRASFDKAFDTDIDFFTLDTSLLDGGDVLAPNDNNIISEWDKYSYVDYSDRVISIEINREELEPYSIVKTFADVTLNNYDNYFTPNSGSPIENFILPKRPFRILGGFDGENVPLFVGLSEKIPSIDKERGTAEFHLIDFLSFIFDKLVDESVMLEDVSTGDVLDNLFQMVGLTTDQYVLDETSFNRINYFYVAKGDRLGTIIQDLMQAEQGRLYLDELGVIRFLNRANYGDTSVYSFDKANTINYEVSTEDDVINYVKLESDILEEQIEQSIYQIADKPYILAGATAEVWANLTDPVTSVTTPTYSETQVAGSHYRSTVDQEGEIPYSDIVIDSIDVFAKAIKIVFENIGSSNAYVSDMDIWGTPVKVVDTIIVEDSDPTSIAALEERRYEFKSIYIQDRNDAINKAALIIDDYKDYGSIVKFEIKGNFALQVGDVVDLDLDGYQGNHIITSIYNSIIGGKFTQRITAKQKDLRQYFILSSDSEARSLLDGTDVLGY